MSDHTEEIIQNIKLAYNVLKAAPDHLITEEIFFKFAEELDPRLMSKLQLSFRDVPRMNHFIRLSEYLLNTPEESIISVEGSNGEFHHDVDFAEWTTDAQNLNKKTIRIIDFTSSTSPELISMKYKALEETAEFISKHFRYNVICLVSQFTYQSLSLKIKYKKTFTMDKGTFSTDLRILQHVHESGQDDYIQFISNCQQVSTLVDDFIMGFKHTEVTNLHKSWSMSQGFNDAALSVCKEFDLTNFKTLCREGLYRYRSIIKTMTLLSNRYMSQCKEHSKKLDLGPAHGSSDNSVESVLDCLKHDEIANAVLNAFRAKKDNRNWHVIDMDGKLSEMTHVESKDDVLMDNDLKFAVRKSEDDESGHWYDMLFTSHIVGFEDYIRYKEKRDLPLKSKDKAFAEPDKADLKDIFQAVDYSIKARDKRFHYLTQSIEHFGGIFEKYMELNKIVGDQGMEHQKLSLSNSSDVAFLLTKSIVGSISAHMHEVAKSFSFGLKAPSRKCKYHLGIAGPFQSIIISKNVGTQDSFKTAPYFVIYNGSNFNSHETSHATVTKGIIRTKCKTMNRNILDYWLRFPMILLSASSWTREFYSNRSDVSLLDLITELFEIAIINRDPFSQSAEQVRYFVMGAMGTGCDFQKICGKLYHLTPMSHTEFIYPIRSMALGIAIDSLRRTGRLMELRNDNEEFSISMPHSKYRTATFSQLISNFYVHKMSNKFRAFKEISEAHCLLELFEEKEILEQRIKEDGGIISGFSPLTRENYRGDYIYTSQFVQSESEYAIAMVMKGVKRFTGSIPYVIGVTSRRLHVNDSLWKDIFSEVYKSPLETATIKGSMKAEEIKSGRQGIRAASSLLEGIISNQGFIPEEVNNPAGSLEHPICMNTISEHPKYMTIASLAAMIYRTGYLLLYAYRIVDKDQVGFREISVLNFLMRMGCLFVETICRVLSKNMQSVDVVNESNKLQILQNMIRKEVKIPDIPPSETIIQIYDNSDQKRWGPNHNMNMFAAFLMPLLHDRPGIYDLTINILYMTTQKHAKFPENLIDLYFKRKGKTGNSVILDKVFEKMTCLDWGECSVQLENGMCQGIYHSNSSIYHGVEAEHTDKMLMLDPLVRSESLVTSDDAERRIDCPISLLHSVSARNHNYVTSIGILFNIIRGNNKSGMGPRAELNSNWFDRSEYMNPSIKEAISKVDVGEGSSFSKDVLHSLEAGAGVFATGCSYTTSMTVTLACLTLVFESWNAWSYRFCWSNDVELLGIPLIEPIITYFTGSMSNVFLKTHLLSRVRPGVFSKYVLSTMLTKFDFVSMSDFLRKPVAEDINFKLKVSDAIEPFYLGISSHSRTPKQVSQFNKRHRLADWRCQPSFFTLNDKSCRTDHLIGSIISRMRQIPSRAFKQQSFYLRFSDPSCNFNRTCIQTCESSILHDVISIKDRRISRSEVLNALRDWKGTPNDYRLSLERKVQELPENILTERLSERFGMAYNLLKEFLKFSEGEGETLTARRGLGYISKISHMEAEVTSTEFYTQMLINSNLKPEIKINLLKTLNVNYAGSENRIFFGNSDMNQLEAIDTLKAMWMHLNKHIKTRITYISKHPASNILECIDDILQFNLVAPNKGVRTFSVGQLSGASSSWVSHKRNMALLDDRSSSIMNYFIQNNFNSISRPLERPKRITITSDQNLLTVNDQFIEFSDKMGPKSAVRFNAKNAQQAQKLVKRWLSANAIYSLAAPFARLICESSILKEGYYRLDNNYFMQLCGQSKISCTTSAGLAYHTIIIKEMLSEEGLSIGYGYKHVFWISDSSIQVTLDSVTCKSDETYVQSLKLLLQGKNIVIGKEYQSGSDIVVFNSLTKEDFELKMFKGCNYICFTSGSELLPMVVAETGQTSERIQMGYTLTQEDSLSAFVNIRKISEMLQSDNEEHVQVASSVVEKILKTNYGQHGMDEFNYASLWGLHLKSQESVDIVRAYLLCSKNRSIPDHLMSHYVNNLFKNVYNRGFTNSAEASFKHLSTAPWSESGNSSEGSRASFTVSGYSSSALSENSEYQYAPKISSALPRKNIIPDHLSHRRILAFVKRTIKKDFTERKFSLFLRDYSALEVPLIIDQSKELSVDLVRKFSNLNFQVPFSVAVALLRHTVGDLADFENPIFDFDIEN